MGLWGVPCSLPVSPAAPDPDPLDDLPVTLGFPCGAAVAATADLPLAASSGVMKQSHIISRNAAEIVAVLGPP